MTTSCTSVVSCIPCCAWSSIGYLPFPASQPSTEAIWGERTCPVTLLENGYYGGRTDDEQRTQVSPWADPLIVSSTGVWKGCNHGQWLCLHVFKIFGFASPPPSNIFDVGTLCTTMSPVNVWAMPRGYAFWVIFSLIFTISILGTFPAMMLKSMKKWSDYVVFPIPYPSLYDRSMLIILTHIFLLQLWLCHI